MTNQHAEPVTTTSAGINEERIAQLRQLFPEAFTEGKIDFDKLRQTLGDFVDDSPERYTFTWAGRRDAIRLLQTPTSATLMPAREESINFDDTSHVFIEGENLEVLKLLYKAYFGKVKLIYIDPPYNTGNDFIYPDNYADPLEPYLQLTGQKDVGGNLLTSNPDSSGRFHSNWLNMMYPRLFVARQLLQDDGVIFVSVDDNELHNLRMALNEIFGEENFIDCMIWKKRYGGGAKEKYLVTLHEYVLFYAKNIAAIANIYVPLDEEAIDRYYRSTDENSAIRGPYRTHPLEATKSVGVRENLVYPIPGPNGEEIWPKRQWWWEKDRTMKALENGELEFVKGQDGDLTVHTKQYLRDANGVIRQTKAFSIIDDIYTQHGTTEINEIFGDSRVFTFPKPTDLIIRMLQMANLEENDIVLDFFSGSNATGHALFRFSLSSVGQSKFLLVQLPEPTPKNSYAHEQGYRTVADIGKERIRRVIQGIQTINEGKFDFVRDTHYLDLGFRVFKLTPSHFKLWSGSPGTDTAVYQSQLSLFRNPLIEGWQAEPVVWEIALKEGYPLHSRLTQASVAGQTVYRVENPDSDQQFHITLEASVTADLPRHLNLTPDDLFVCRDLALNDTTAANLALQCRLKTI